MKNPLPRITLLGATDTVRRASVMTNVPSLGDQGVLE